MIIRLDPAASGSPSEQLVTQIAASIDSGDVQAGERLPTIRSLAADLGLAPGTVAKAYAELERDGWIHSQGRRGTIAANRKPEEPERELARAAAELARAATAIRKAPIDAHRALDLAFARLARDT